MRWVCYRGCLWWNGCIPTNRINSTDPATGKPNRVMGAPSNYRPSAEPLIPWPANPDRSDPMYAYYGTNTVWVPMKNGTTTRNVYNDNLAPWRNQYRPGVRQWGLDASLFKAIPIGERVNIRFNADFFNVLDHPGNLNSVGGDGIPSVRASGQSAREIHLTLRLTWQAGPPGWPGREVTLALLRRWRYKETMHPRVHLGSQGPAVRELQQLLNRSLDPNPRLAVDGTFGAATDTAARRFQREKWLLEDGIVGRCTWAALERTERYVILHSVALVAQWTPSTCWSAATAMILGVQACMAPGGAQLGSSGGILNDSDLDDPANMRLFAEYHGLTMLAPQTWTPDGLAGLLRAHPLMINTLWDVAGYVARRGSSGHMRVVAGIRGDGTGDGTTLRIYDPWPPNQGEIYSRIYGPFIRQVPAATYQVFYR